MKTYKKIAAVSCCVLMGLSLSSCGLMAKKPVTKPAQTRVTKTPVKKRTDVVFKELQNKPPATETQKPKSELFPGNNRFVANEAPQHRRLATTGTGSYSLNFDDADLGEVAKVILGDILKQNYVLSPKVAGKVTLQTTEPLTDEELLPTLEMVLRMNSAALVRDGRIYHIEPAADALYTSNIANSRSGYQTRVIPVRNVAVQDIADVIKPLVQEKTILNVDGTRNIMVVSGTADEIARVLDMVDTFDIDVLKGRSFGLFPLTHADPETVIKELEGIFYKKGKSDESEFFQFMAIERLNAILAITHQARYLEDINNWVGRLDKANTATGGGVNVYKVQNVDATELADTLNEIFTGAAPKKNTQAKLAPGQKSASATNKQPTKQTVAKTSASANTGGAAATGDSKVSNVGDVRIIADEPNNSVIVVATTQEYEVILPIIKQLDILPLQVLIDATIAEVTLTNDLKYGISWYLHSGNDALAGTGSPPGAVANTLGTAADAAAAAATGGFSAIYSSQAVKALLNTQAKKNNINIVSSPSLMVLNNQEASMQVGTEISLRTGQTTNLNSTTGNTTTGTGLLQTNPLEQRKTGVKLKIKPRVNASGLVIMEIDQSVEDPGSAKSDGSNPDILTREIKSSVAVQTGETIVLGGLIRENNTYGTSGIPYFNELPVVGPLFGGTTKNVGRTELVVLITPRVVQTKQDAKAVTDEFKRKLTGIYKDALGD
ncbi:MAG: type II secretion system secretin GspD [Methylococcaceae bacterium]|nr:type II secretion system secretin GspD [Methylococcaceae bacterium]